MSYNLLYKNSKFIKHKITVQFKRINRSDQTFRSILSADLSTSYCSINHISRYLRTNRQSQAQFE